MRCNGLCCYGFRGSVGLGENIKWGEGGGGAKYPSEITSRMCKLLLTPKMDTVVYETAAPGPGVLPDIHGNQNRVLYIWAEAKQVNKKACW